MRARRAPFPRQRGDRGEAASGLRQERPGAVGGQEAVAAGFDAQSVFCCFRTPGLEQGFQHASLGLLSLIHISEPTRLALI
eukprot:10687972-Alexandrium_andersonii.AAC.1